MNEGYTQKKERIYKIGEKVLFIIYILAFAMSIFVFVNELKTMETINVEDIVWGIIGAIIVPFGFAGFFYFGLYFVFKYDQDLIKSGKKCTESVDAVIFDFETKYGPKYFAIYEYRWQDTLFQTKSELDYGKKPKIGNKHRLMLNPSSPTEIYEIDLEKKRIWKNRSWGLVFGSMGVFSMFIMIVYLLKALV